MGMVFWQFGFSVDLPARRDPKPLPVRGHRSGEPERQQRIDGTDDVDDAVSDASTRPAETEG